MVTRSDVAALITSTILGIFAYFLYSRKKLRFSSAKLPGRLSAQRPKLRKVRSWPEYDRVHHFFREENGQDKRPLRALAGLTLNIETTLKAERLRDFSRFVKAGNIFHVLFYKDGEWYPLFLPDVFLEDQQNSDALASVIESVVGQDASQVANMVVGLVSVSNSVDVAVSFGFPHMLIEPRWIMKIKGGVSPSVIINGWFLMPGSMVPQASKPADFVLSYTTDDLLHLEDPMEHNLGGRMFVGAIDPEESIDDMIKVFYHDIPLGIGD